MVTQTELIQRVATNRESVKDLASTVNQHTQDITELRMLLGQLHARHTGLHDHLKQHWHSEIDVTVAFLRLPWWKRVFRRLRIAGDL